MKKKQKEKLKVVKPQEKVRNPINLQKQFYRHKYLHEVVPRNIAKSKHTITSIIPYIARILNEGPVTDLQKNIFKTIDPEFQEDFQKTFLKTFLSLPQTIIEKWNPELFTLPMDEIDDFIQEDFEKSLDELQTSTQVKNDEEDFKITDGFITGIIPSEDSRFRKVDISEIELPPRSEVIQNFYRIRAEYRGISTLKVHDQIGGSNKVEPYFVVGAFCIPNDSEKVQQITSPTAFQHVPWNQCIEMEPGEWSPMSGKIDDNGDPLFPIQIIPQLIGSHVISTSPIDEGLLVSRKERIMIVIIAMEKDTDDTEEVIKLIKQGIDLIQTFSPAGPQQILSITAKILSVLGFLFSLREDDCMGVITHTLTTQDYEIEGYREFQTTLTKGHNTWIIYYGIESKKIQ